MQAKTPANTKPNTLGFINVEVQVQAKDGTWYTHKGGIPITDKRKCDLGLIANPSAIEDSKRVKMSCSIHVMAAEPEGDVDF